MAWNSDAPMELLAHMPAKLTRDNLAEIQKVIDSDKMAHSMRSGKDLCGEYAPFCICCDKNETFPCAVAYVRMKQSEGLDLEIAAAEDEAEPAPKNNEDKSAEDAEPVVAEAPQAEPEAEPVAEPEEEVPAKKRIRIAVARRKN